VGKPPKRAPRLEGGNPRPLFGTWGVVKEGGGCNHIEGRTKRGGREGQRRGELVRRGSS
jgi:hypothetical protein